MVLPHLAQRAVHQVHHAEHEEPGEPHRAHRDPPRASLVAREAQVVTHLAQVGQLVVVVQRGGERARLRRRGEARRARGGLEAG